MQVVGVLISGQPVEGIPDHVFRFLKVALGLGKGRDRVLTCDLTKDYVAINGDYRS